MGQERVGGNLCTAGPITTSIVAAVHKFTCARSIATQPITTPCLTACHITISPWKYYLPQKFNSSNLHINIPHGNTTAANTKRGIHHITTCICIHADTEVGHIFNSSTRVSQAHTTISTTRVRGAYSGIKFRVEIYLVSPV